MEGRLYNTLVRGCRQTVGERRGYLPGFEMTSIQLLLLIWCGKEMTCLYPLANGKYLHWSFVITLRLYDFFGHRVTILHCYLNTNYIISYIILLYKSNNLT